MAEQVGPYEVTELLASGGMAEIYIGRKTGPGGFDKPVVVKRIHKKLLGDREIEAMFVDEARVQALLDHPNIVQIYDFGEDRGAYFIVMEFIPGATLRWVIDNATAVRRPLPVAHALRIAGDVLAGLHYAHELRDTDGQPLRLIHRDISPVNVLVSRTGVAKLCDFGVAKSEMQRVLTRAGIIKGKFRYMAPEQINAENLDRRADVFAVGCVLWEMVVGRRLFDMQSEDDVVVAIRSGNYPAPSDLRPDVPRDIDRMLRRALHPNRDKRFRTAREFYLACEEVLRALPVPSNSAFVGEYVSAELDGMAASMPTPMPRKPTAADPDSVLASSFQVLDPPVPTSPTTIQSAGSFPAVEDSEPSVRLEPGSIGRMLGAALMAPAALFGAIGRSIEGAVTRFSAPRPKAGRPEVRVTRTSSPRDK